MGGKPKAPKPPPPPVAPVRQDAETGIDQALLASRRRKGLRRTILAATMSDVNPAMTDVASNTLGQSTALGAANQTQMNITQ